MNLVSHLYPKTWALYLGENYSCVLQKWIWFLQHYHISFCISIFKWKRGERTLTLIESLHYLCLSEDLWVDDKLRENNSSGGQKNRVSSFSTTPQPAGLTDSCQPGSLRLYQLCSSAAASCPASPHAPAQGTLSPFFLLVGEPEGL